MKRIKTSLSRFFFPPAGSPRWVRILPYAIMGVLTLLVLTAGAYAWDYTNSPPFCGETCHTMPPEYTAYLTSPHARIDCVDCHIGKGFIATRITRKAGDAKHIISLAFKDYEFPIRANDLRPARETCELCHSPEKFSDDSLREIRSYSNDRSNTPISTYLVLKTGGGSKRVGLGRGIHWHIENRVLYLTNDPEEQEIPFIRVLNEDGSVNEYLDVNAEIEPGSITDDQLQEMDCITCHNRITHLVLPPEETIDELITRNQIGRDIPDIRRLAVEVYGRSYGSLALGLEGIAGLESYYQVYEAAYYAANQEKIQQAIEVLQQAYQNSIFPEQKSDWNSHPNNVGHKNSPGCFRCHDGKHLSVDGEAIRLECNLCHSVPVVSTPNDFVADIEISRGPEPESHRNSNWISLHNQALDQSCANCHSTGNPGGSDNTSFCSNSACHGRAWDHAGFDAPGLRERIISQLPPTPTPAPIPSGGPLTYEAAIQPLLEARCGSCHGAPKLQGLNLLTYADALQGGSSGPAILPGDPQGSLLVQKMSAEQPHFALLSAEELERVVAWIEAGAAEK